MQDFHKFLEAKSDKACKTACCGGQKTPKEEKGIANGHQPQTDDGCGPSDKKQKGFGEEGDKDLVYDPTKKSKPGKVSTAEALAAARTIRDAISENPRFVEYVVAEINRAGLMGCLVGELVGYQETYQNLAQVMGSKDYGQRVCDRLARALREDVSSPFGQNQDMGDDQAGAPDMGGDDMGAPDMGAPDMGAEGNDEISCPKCGAKFNLVPAEGGDDAPNPFEDDEEGDNPFGDPSNPLMANKGKLSPEAPGPGAMPQMAHHHPRGTLAMEHFQRSMRKRFK